MLLDFTPKASHTGFMTQRSLVTYLTSQAPGHTIDSAYELSHRFRVAEQTARNAMEAEHYVVEHGRWVKQVTQLDRIEQTLAALINLVQSLAVVHEPKMENGAWAVGHFVSSENAQV